LTASTGYLNNKRKRLRDEPAKRKDNEPYNHTNRRFNNGNCRGWRLGRSADFTRKHNVLWANGYTSRQRGYGMTDKIIRWDKYYAARQVTLEDMSSMEYCRRAKEQLNGLCKPTLSDRAQFNARYEYVYNLDQLESCERRMKDLTEQQCNIDFYQMLMANKHMTVKEFLEIYKESRRVK